MRSKRRLIWLVPAGRRSVATGKVYVNTGAGAMITTRTVIRFEVVRDAQKCRCLKRRIIVR